MAVTKIHPIKSTLKKALDYIENSVKTDEKILVSSFACSYETADIEFELLLSQAMQKGNNLAHHLIQSFAPGETTPEQAHEIGRQLADEVLQGKYPYVLTTHIDKGHVHNHIIFCAVDIDLENSIKAQQSAGYEKWAKLHNLKQAARTLNFLTEHEIDSYPDLESRVAEITAASTEAAAALKAAERRLAEMAVLIKDVTTCKELHPLLQEYQRAADKKQFRRKHEGTLILYEAAAKALKEQGFQKLPDLYALKNEYKQLAEQKDQMQRQYNDAKRQMQEYGIIKQNVDGILRTAPGKEQMQER